MRTHRRIVRFLCRVVLLVGIGIISLGIVSGMASRASAQADPEASQDVEEDPWEPFNESNFEFNRGVDRYALKPIATGYDAVLPDLYQQGIMNVIRNLGVVRRLVNNLFQLKFEGAGRELVRFTVNSTFGIGGLIDVARDGIGIKESDEDTGQTLGYYGVGQGPYLVLPFLPVMTVRDGFGALVDTAMNPLIYVAPAGVTLGIQGTDVVNDRSLNLDKFQRVEDSVIDLYSAVRSAYLQRREAAVKD
ncbi:MAG: VacJ family lipoprotein [Candidatus Binatia bacterium]